MASASAILVFPRATPGLVERHLRPGARILAIDAGAEALRALGVLPHAVVGDMDSVSGETLARLREAGVEVHEHPPAKRDTDAALALALVPPEAEDVVFVGSGGGRADHALANLHLLASVRGRARAVDEDARTWIVAPERPLRLDRPVGTVISVFPFDEVCEGVSYEGLAYPLEDAVMRAGDPYGISNRCVAPRQRIRVRRGRLVVIEPVAPEG